MVTYDEDAVAERMRIDSSGKVGIGTSSPGHLFHVSGTGGGSFTSGYANALARINATTNTAGQGAALALSAIATKETAWIISAEHTSGNNGDLAFYGYPGGGSYAERLRIDSSGNVKIPAGNFDLRVGDDIDANAGAQTISVGSVSSGSGGFQCFASPTNGQSYLQFGDGSAAASQYRGYVGYKHADDALVVGTAATERMRIDSSGNVVIGATTTEAQNQSILTVNDQGSRAGYVSFENRQNFGWGVGIKLRMPVVNNGAVVNSGKIYSGWESSDKSYMQFSTYNGSEFERLRIDSSGNVGIGTSTPTASDCRHRYYGYC